VSGGGSLARGIGSIQPDPDQPIFVSLLSITNFLHHVVAAAMRRVPAVGPKRGLR
jgi:hypothetical protein